MSDHVDGPRVMADPQIDISDLYVFTSPEDRRRTVVILDVCPFAGENSLFSNSAEYRIAIRRVSVTGRGTAAGFRSADHDSVSFGFRFEALKPGTNGQLARQTGTATVPGGSTIPIVVGDEDGAYSADRRVRVFAGVRSDPFFMGWLPGADMKPMPNYLQEDNCLSIAVEFDTAMLNPGGGTLFGVIAETIARSSKPWDRRPPRFDWVGRPEQTNYRFNFAPDSSDIRDIYNQETPFALDPATRPLYAERLTKSLELWDERDKKRDWDAALLQANVNVFLDDYLTFDVAKPITDTSHLEIEKSTIDGRAYTTGGGRTLDANAIDILVTWLVNRDRGPFMQSAVRATKPGGRAFPYVQPPNETLLTVSQSVDLGAAPATVWAKIGPFGSLPSWHPLVAGLTVTGTGPGELREIETIDGKTIVERLASQNDTKMITTYTLVSGVPATRYTGTLGVTPKGSGSTVTWTVHYRPDGQTEFIVHLIVTTLLKTGLSNLKTMFGAG